MFTSIVTEYELGQLCFERLITLNLYFQHFPPQSSIFIFLFIYSKFPSLLEKVDKTIYYLSCSGCNVSWCCNIWSHLRLLWSKACIIVCNCRSRVVWNFGWIYANLGIVCSGLLFYFYICSCWICCCLCSFCRDSWSEMASFINRT